MTMTTHADGPEFDLTITRMTRRRAPAGGTWVKGSMAGHRIEALVFPDHAADPDYELGRTRISKLWVQRARDRRVVFNFDRGLDVPAADATAERIVAAVGECLAGMVFGTGTDVPPTATQLTRRSRRAAPAVPVGPEFATAAEAIRHAAEHRPVAIAVAGRHLVVPKAEADRLAAAGVAFAYLAEVEGRVVTVPVNG
jgi:hypothetical protein